MRRRARRSCIATPVTIGRFGGLVSLAYTERSLLEEGHSTVRWQPGTLTCPACDALPTTAERDAANAAVDAAFTPRLPRYGILDHDLERLGVTGSLQFRPSDRTELSLDLLYANLDSTRTENFLEAPDFSAGGAGGRAGIDVLSYTIDARNNLIVRRVRRRRHPLRVAIRRAVDRVQSDHARADSRLQRQRASECTGRQLEVRA